MEPGFSAEAEKEDSDYNQKVQSWVSLPLELISLNSAWVSWVMKVDSFIK